MRLIHTSTLQLESFLGQDIPPYAILSHTWGEDEVSYDHVRRGIQYNLKKPSRGLCKILNTCAQARQENLHYAWIDTCCIDKTNSTELFEAINSMFKWYKNSAACYVYMEDVILQLDGTVTNFETSRWFTRGWTLQELIAPHGLAFFDCNWSYLRSRHEISEPLAKITGIYQHILLRRHSYSPGPPRPDIDCRACRSYDCLQPALEDASIAGKMKWAAKRVTTREEDMAYCLMGLFGVTMPLLYGEGKTAFQRLQQEILRISPDQTILAWTAPPFETTSRRSHTSYLPDRPSAFQLEAFHHKDWQLGPSDIAATTQGLEVEVVIGPCAVAARDSDGKTIMAYDLWLAALGCTVEADYLTRVAIFVHPLRGNSPQRGYIRDHTNSLVILKPDANPQVIGSLSIFSSELDPLVKTISVDYNIKKFRPQRILLASGPLGRNNYDEPPQLTLTVRGSDGWRLQAAQPSLTDGRILPFGNIFPDINPMIDSVTVFGTLCFSNDTSCFFVLWGMKNPGFWGPTSTKCKIVSWIENWDSFIPEDSPRMTAGNVTPEVLKKARSHYARHFEEHPFTDPGPELSGLDFQASAQVSTVDFMGRRSYTLSVEIQSLTDGEQKAVKGD